MTTDTRIKSFLFRSKYGNIDKYILMKTSNNILQIMIFFFGVKWQKKKKWPKNLRLHILYNTWNRTASGVHVDLIESVWCFEHRKPVGIIYEDGSVLNRHWNSFEERRQTNYFPFFFPPTHRDEFSRVLGIHFSETRRSPPKRKRIRRGGVFSFIYL